MRFALFVLFTMGLAQVATAQDYQKATDGDEVVLNKLYPKSDRIELSLGAGTIMNQSYLTTLFASGNISYFPDEYWGIGVTGLFMNNQDNHARTCVETFYNDLDEDVPAECLADDPGESIRASENGNLGPAYVPVRELQSIIAADFLWNPVYGKQIVLLSRTSYFDLQVHVGGGVAISKYYGLRTHIRDRPDVSARGVLPTAENPDLPPVGVGIDDRDDLGVFYGAEGRPFAEMQTTPMTSLGLTQRFHFAKRFSLAFQFKNYTLLGTPQGFETYFTLGGVLGVRF